MRDRKGLTLIEIIMVMVMIAVATAFFFPNFTAQNEHAYASVAKNNLMAIYSAQKNYYNNSSSTPQAYCLNLAGTTASGCPSSDTECGGTLADLNCNLGLSIQDDGSYAYDCKVDPAGSGFSCAATRANTNQNISLTVTNAPFVAGTNPSCTAPGHSAWCP